MPFNMEGIAVMSGAYPAVANMPFASHQGNYPARNYKVDKINGRKLSPMPAQLGRVLYVPHHEQGTRHIALSDVTSTYDEEMGDVQYGSSEYKRRLGIMKKPSETAEPQFVVDVASDGASLTVQDTSSEKGYKGHM